jgi:hypothetical protein
MFKLIMFRVADNAPLTQLLTNVINYFLSIVILAHLSFLNFGQCTNRAISVLNIANQQLRDQYPPPSSILSGSRLLSSLPTMNLVSITPAKNPPICAVKAIGIEETEPINAKTT